MSTGQPPPPFEDDEDEALLSSSLTPAEINDLPLEKQVAVLQHDFGAVRRALRTLLRWRNWHNRVHQGHDEWAGVRSQRLQRLEDAVFGNDESQQPGLFTRISEMERNINRRLRAQSAQNWAILLALLALIGSLVALLTLKG